MNQNTTLRPRKPPPEVRDDEDTTIVVADGRADTPAMPTGDIGDDCYEEDSLPSPYPEIDDWSRATSPMRSGREHDAAVGSEFLRSLLAHPGLARQVAALPVAFDRFGIDEENAREAVLVEAIRRMKDGPENWLQGVRDALRDVKKDPGRLLSYADDARSAADEMLEDGWLEASYDEAPAQANADRKVQLWLKQNIVLRMSEFREAGQLLSALADLTAMPVETVEPQETAGSFEPFPVHLLPAVARELVQHTAQSKCVDPAMAALPALVQMGSAVGLSRRVAVKSDWWEYPIVWGGIIADSGQLKTPTLTAVVAPMMEHQLQLKAMFDVHRENEHNERSEAQHESRCYVAPTLEHVFTTDATMEAVANMLRTSPRGICVASDELAKWLGVGEYKKNGAMNDQARSLELFSGGVWKVDRKTDKEPLIIPRAGAWAIGGIQPRILWTAFGDSSEVNGKLARHLLVLPPGRTQGWSDHVIPEEVTQRWSRLNHNLYRFSFDENREPRVVTMAPGATQLMKDYTNAMEASIGQETDEKVMAMLRKMVGYAARFALILHCARQAESEGNSAWEWSSGWDVLRRDDIERGIELSWWFANEARRIYALKTQMRTANSDLELLSFIRSKGAVTARDLMQYDRRSYSRAQVAQEELELLAADGKGRWAMVKPLGPGRPTKKFVPSAVEGNGHGS